MACDCKISNISLILTLSKHKNSSTNLRRPKSAAQPTPPPEPYPPETAYSARPRLAPSPGTPPQAPAYHGYEIIIVLTDDYSQQLEQEPPQFAGTGATVEVSVVCRHGCNGRSLRRLPARVQR